MGLISRKSARTIATLNNTSQTAIRAKKTIIPLLCKVLKVPAVAIFGLLIVNVLLGAKLIHWNTAAFKNINSDVDLGDRRLGMDRALTYLNDETNVPIPTDKHGNQLSLEARIRYLELKTNSFMNFGSNPFFGVVPKPSLCQRSSTLQEFGCKAGRVGVDKDLECPGLFDHKVCLDELPKPRTKQESSKAGGKKNSDDPPCLIYDFGIREQPQFGATMAIDFGCEVHGFDPSLVSTNWWDSNRAKELRELPNYHFHPYGAGGVDGVVTLKEYNWDQVSILRYPTYTLDCEGRDPCGLVSHDSKAFKIPVKTLPTIIKELGHEGKTIDVLKIDVEGSEYAFLENLLDSTGGCPDFIKQISMEWHHFSWDSRYGEGASPSINAIVTLLHTCGLKNFWQYSEGGWPAGEKIYQDLGMKDVRYNLASFLLDTSKRKGSLRATH
uniref:Methyltransferase FkbM domain-containing protein n=1 Tax=Eucampia antarctica TaxID=49252 RepID=A0A7S2WQJ2_9STRA|mmetsp:Transcript_8384/g.7937  ORF Transcript_8384/g.7937 Transcript_8384/m.7937 type:complete len:439 (+) Transcript_8384:40-1356(+)